MASARTLAEDAGECWQILMACECAGIAGRMKTIIPHSDVEPAPIVRLVFLFFVFICAHLFSFIVSLCGFASVVLILLVLFYYSVLIISVMDMRIGFVCERRDYYLIVFSLFSL